MTTLSSCSYSLWSGNGTEIATLIYKETLCHMYFARLASETNMCAPCGKQQCERTSDDEQL